QYLADKAGNTSLFPIDARTRADITRWQCWQGLYFNAALGTLAFETVAKPRNNAGAPDTVLIEQARATPPRFAPVLDGHMNGRKYLVNDHLTVADYLMVALEPYVSLVPFDFSPYEHIHAYFDRMRQSEYWARTGKRAPVSSIAA